MEPSPAQSEIQPKQSDDRKKLIIVGITVAFLVVSISSGAGLYFFVFNKSEIEEVATEKEIQPIASIDSDSDGLTDQEEISIYGTDPNNLDTDGDGYSDGDEVDAGYNPLGSGKLVEGQERQGESNQIIEDQTINWKTYRNEKYRYELRYPSDWNLSSPEQYRPDVTIFNPFSGLLLSKKDSSREEQLEILKKSAHVRIVVNYFSPQLGFDRTIENIKKYNPNTLKQDTIIVDGINGIRVGATFGNEELQWSAEYAVVLNTDANLMVGDNMYTSATYTIEGVFQSESDTEPFNQILSTFKFIE